MSSSLINYFPIFVHLLSTLSLWISSSLWRLPRQAFVFSTLLLSISSLEKHLLLKMSLNPVTRSQLLSSLIFLWHLTKKTLTLEDALFVCLFHCCCCFSCHTYIFSWILLLHLFLPSLWHSGAQGLQLTFWLSLSSSIARLNIHFSSKDFLVTAPTTLLGPHTHAPHDLLQIREI